MATVTDVAECGRCELPMASFVAGSGVCIRCHDRLYGKDHRPMGVKQADGQWIAGCLKPGCQVPTGKTQRDTAEAARLDAYLLHHDAVRMRGVA